MYENNFPNNDPNSVGLAVIALSDKSIVYAAYPTFGFGFEIKANTRIGYLTGRWINEDEINFVQVAFENPVTDDQGRTFTYGCVNAAQYRTAKIGTNSGAQSMMNALITNNKVILENNLLCAGMLNYMTSNNIEVPLVHKKNLYRLQSRLIDRN